MLQSIRPRLSAAIPTYPSRPGPTNADGLIQLWHWFLPSSLLSGVTRHGNSTWSPRQLVIQAVCWTWSNARTLTEAFDEAAHSCRTLLGSSALSTYQGFMAALTKWSATLMGELIVVFRRHAQTIGGRFWRVGRWVPIAFDGSRTAAPRTRSNEAAYCAAHYGTGATARYRQKKTKGMRRRNNQKNPAQEPQPQVWMTLLWHMGLRLPWAWRLGPSNASERDHVMTMLAEEDFPRRTLFCGDAGFIGYPLWSRILKRNGDFLVRVGANARLLIEELRGRIAVEAEEQFVWCWPLDAQRAGEGPLRLRLIHTRLKTIEIWLLTSVLDSTRLSRSEILRLYRMRWGIEVEFRGLKQTLNRAELRCRNESRVGVELDWSILAMAVAELWALKEQLAQPAAQSRVPKPPGPDKRSLSGTMRALRWCLRNLRERCEPGRSLRDRLRAAVTDDYQRSSSKGARYRPHNPDKKPLGEPQLRVLTKEELQMLPKQPLTRAA